MSHDVLVDAESLRSEVRNKYRAVAAEPGGTYHFHTGRSLATRLGYDPAVVYALPRAAVESFAGVANPFALRRLRPGDRVVDVGSGAGWQLMIEEAGFVDIRIGERVDTFGGAGGETNARAYEVFGYPFVAVEPS